MPISGSTVVRRQLGRRLRRLRDAAGKTDRDIEEACLASRAKLWRIESGKGPVKVADVRAPAYVRTLCEASNPERPESVVARLVNLRLERQKVLDRTPPLQLTAVINAGALARQVGGAATMAEQVGRLRELNRREQIDLRVLPFEVGAHAAMAGPFTIFDFDDPDDPPVVYLDTHTGARYLEKPGELAEHRRMFGLIYRQSIPIEEHTNEP
jgi:hypothetical protein